MGILVKKQRGIFIVTGIAKLSIIAFIVALAFASINTIWALYIDSFVHSESFVGLISSLLAVISFLSYLKNNNIKKKSDVNLIKNFLEFFKDKNRVMAYFISGGLSLWWGSLIYLFMPLYIIRSNLDNLWVGYFLFAIVIPLILLEYKFSKLAVKTGFKKMFMLGFFIAFLASLICFFLSNIYLILLILALASIGLAMIEPNSESFFFESLATKEEELKYYSPYNTSIE